MQVPARQTPPSSPHSMNYTIKRPIRRLHTASLQQYYSFRAARIIYGGAAEAAEQTSSLLSNWLLAEMPLCCPQHSFLLM